MTYGIIKVIAHYMPLRVSDRDEAIGLDDCEHKETAYPTFMGLDSKEDIDEESRSDYSFG